ncbi:MAG TPA: ABC transporter permease subunit [Acidimicrobiales bacterium]|nr:ABC transporter permease subunit [Acidimicrobiales bacterium]
MTATPHLAPPLVPSPAPDGPPGTAPGGPSEPAPSPRPDPLNPGFARRYRLALRFPSVALSVVLWAVLALLLIVPILLFLITAISPRLLSQGTQWFTLSNFHTAFTGFFARGLVNSLWLSSLCAVLALAISLALAWGVQRTNLIGRRAYPLAVWALLLMPSFLVAEGWEYLLQPHGVLNQFGIPTGSADHLFFGPMGVVFVDTMTIVPFAFMAVSVSLANLGSEFEDAARVHGAGRWRTARVVLPILAPAMLSALAIGFAETISDFGVASTLAATSHFPVATYNLFQAVDSNPSNFGVASAISWVLVAAAAIPIAIQARALRGRSYAVLSGRTRQPVRRHLSGRGQVIGTTAACGLFVLALGAPITGAVVASLLKGFGTNFSAHALTLANYRLVFNGTAGLAGPLLYSTRLAVIAATITAVLGLVVARVMTAKGAGAMGKLMDLILIGSVALPGIVLGAGYIFAYNLPLASNLGLALYGTTPLLALGYLATSLPGQSRLMVGPVSQLQDSLLDAARVHGARGLAAWRRAALPILSRLLLWAWLLTFAKTLLELPVSQLLFPPGNATAAVAINNFVGTSAHYGEATAMSVVAMAEMFGVILIGLGLFRWLAPRGWQRIGGFVDV